MGICCMMRGPDPVLYDDLEGWDGVEDGKEFPEGPETRIRQTR